MNKRIKELAEHAGLLPKIIGPVVETRHVKKKEQDLEKFAELIVRECAKQVSDFYQEDEFSCFCAKEAILDHFGVEE